MRTVKPAPGDIWQTDLGGYVLVAGVDSGHVVACPVAVLPDGSVIAYPRGRKAERLLLTAFSRGRYQYIGVAKATPRTVAR
ncbi:hypothetical protein [Streptomyces sp. NPDC012888]|uniref:hypothetical protein n=1 Tax=Streptomyces sp. NPDC012888 TaxID=3364855 RepID=UPI0036C9FD09